MSNHPPLTYASAVYLGQLLEAVSSEHHVRWSPEDTDLVYEGTLRHVVVSPDNFGFLRADEDVRDGYIRITTTGGMETTLPVMRALELYQLTLLVFE